MAVPAGSGGGQEAAQAFLQIDRFDGSIREREAGREGVHGGWTTIGEQAFHEWQATYRSINALATNARADPARRDQELAQRHRRQRRVSRT